MSYQSNESCWFARKLAKNGETPEGGRYLVLLIKLHYEICYQFLHTNMEEISKTLLFKYLVCCVTFLLPLLKDVKFGIKLG